MGYKQEIQAKKGPKKVLSHNERPNDLPTTVDWDEQERIRNSLKNKYLNPMPRTSGRKNSYSPEIGAELVIYRRQGWSMKRICEQTGHTPQKIAHWLSEQPEFAQEWSDAYTYYLTDTAEDLVPRAEALLEGLKLNGKKLPPKQMKYYMRALEILANEAHWAASRRVPEYKEDDNGSELVIIQPQELERVVTQDTPAAERYKQQLEEEHDETETRLSLSVGADGEEREEPGLLDAPRAEQPGNAEGEVHTDKRRRKRSTRPLAQLSKRLPDEESRFESLRDGGTQGSDPN